MNTSYHFFKTKKVTEPADRLKLAGESPKDMNTRYFFSIEKSDGPR